MLFRGAALTFFYAYLSDLNFQSLEAEYRYRDPEFQLGENYSYLFILGPIICKRIKGIGMSFFNQTDCK